VFIVLADIFLITSIEIKRKSNQTLYRIHSMIEIWYSILDVEVVDGGLIVEPSAYLYSPSNVYSVQCAHKRLMTMQEKTVV